MSWENSIQIEERLSKVENPEKLKKIHSLYTFISATIFPENYITCADYVNAIVLTPHGEEAVDAAKESGEEFSEPDLLLAALRCFYHHDFLIDTEHTDIDKALSIYSSELIDGKIKLPHRFGRSLYDKFNDMTYHNRMEYLNPEDVDTLLNETEIGVYQVGTLITGPLGVLDSNEIRYLKPVKNLSLWHCSDTGCHAVHLVELRPHLTSLETAYNFMFNKLENLLGPASDWDQPFLFFSAG